MSSASRTPGEAFLGHVALPGVKLWYLDTGGPGFPVVLLHANTGNLDGWQYNTPAFLEAGYRVIAFDRRGWGRSTPDPATGPQPATIADDLHALVEYLGLESFHLVGVAGGGFAAYDYVLWHPERVRSLVIAASSGNVEDAELAALREKTRLPNFQSWPAEFREVSMDYMATNPEGLKQWLEIHENAQQPGAPAQGTRQPITYAKLETIRTPTLILPADIDLQSPPWVMRAQAARIPGAELSLVPGAAHSINWEQPETFNRIILDFLKRH
jgi:pimeloyl-ACP methyl ester carboxylesterase